MEKKEPQLAKETNFANIVKGIRIETKVNDVWEHLENSYRIDKGLSGRNTLDDILSNH